jgi:hypothetical protein
MRSGHDTDELAPSQIKMLNWHLDGGSWKWHVKIEDIPATQIHGHPFFNDLWASPGILTLPEVTVWIPKYRFMIDISIKPSRFIGWSGHAGSNDDNCVHNPLRGKYQLSLVIFPDDVTVDDERKCPGQLEFRHVRDGIICHAPSCVIAA